MSKRGGNRLRSNSGEQQKELIIVKAALPPVIIRMS
jgi:hypothetical protein